MKCLLMPILLLATSFALANGTPAPMPTTPGPSAESASQAVSSAQASSAATSTATQTQMANGTAAATQSQTALGGTSTSSAQGGYATGGNSQSTSSASNQGNTQGVTISENHPRNAPSLGQGSTYIGSCGAGGTAGGSGVNGAGFLGWSWTPADCKLLLAADAYRALGMVDAACSMVNRISTVQKAWKDLGVPPPDCVTKPPVAPPAPVVDASQYATHEEVNQAFKRSVQK
jgi:hypothetical protein